MRITHEDGRFVAVEAYQDRDELKRAGFAYTKSRGWMVRDWRKALRFEGDCDDLAQAEISRQRNEERASLLASRAQDSDLDLPCPTGLSYLPFQRAGIAYALRIFGDLPDAS